jgi:hypothetical protein
MNLVKRRPVLLVAALVSVALAGRFALVAGFDAPWVAPDEMLYALLGESVWEDARYEVLGVGTPYYGLYGLVPGGLVAALGPAGGLLATQIVQVLAVGGTAVLVLVWARKVASLAWAVAAAVLTLALPGLDLAGLMMTETLFVASVTLALFAIAVALAGPTHTTLLFASGAILLAAQVRIQGLLLIPLFVACAVATAVLTRDGRLLRACAPAAAGLGAWAVAWLLLTQDEGGTLGAYSTVLQAQPSAAEALEWVVWHAADVVVMVIAIPLVATLALGVLAVRRIERDRDVIALAVTAIGWLLTTVATVGLFAAQHVGHVAGRDLLSVAPPLFVGFAAWASRGAWRRPALTALVALPVAALVVAAPERVIAPVTASPDALGLIPLRILSESSSGLVFRIVLVAGALAVAVAAVVVARAGVAGVAALALALVGGLGATSVVAAHRIDSRAAFDRSQFFGEGDRSWIDDGIGGPTTLLDEGTFFWNDFWHQAFWNDDVAGVASLVPDNPKRPLPGRVDVTLYDDGTLRRDDGRPFVAQDVVADEFATLVGERRAGLERRRLPDLVGWRTAGPVALSLRLRGTELGGTTNGPFEIEVFRCRGGRVTMPVRAVRRPAILTWAVQARTPRSRVIHTGAATTLRFTLPRRPPSGLCVVSLEATSTVAVGPVRRAPALTASPPAPDARPLFDLPRIPSKDTQVGYCVDGTFVQLDAGQPRTDPAYRGAVPAFFVEGTGLTCTVPAGYRGAGFAGRPQGVPAGIYPYYVPE